MKQLIFDAIVFGLIAIPTILTMAMLAGIR